MTIIIIIETMINSFYVTYKAIANIILFHLFFFASINQMKSLFIYLIVLFIEFLLYFDFARV